MIDIFWDQTLLSIGFRDYYYFTIGLTESKHFFIDYRIERKNYLNLIYSSTQQQIGPNISVLRLREKSNNYCDYEINNFIKFYITYRQLLFVVIVMIKEFLFFWVYSHDFRIDLNWKLKTKLSIYSKRNVFEKQIRIKS